MADFSIADGDPVEFIDTSPGGGLVINFDKLDNSFNLQINGVQLFVGGPAGAANELQFQVPGTSGQTVRFADGDRYEFDTPEVWRLGNTNMQPVVRLEINPDGTIALYGVKTNNGPLEPLELFNGLTVNTAAIAAAWNDNGSNTILLDQSETGPTNAMGKFVDVLCFASGTLIETLQGLVRVEDLQVSDQVLTYDNGYKPIRWIGSRGLSSAELDAQPRLKPILIRANTLGEGYPNQDLIVSPQHRILVSSAIAMRMFDCKDVLIPANKLLSLEGVDVMQDAPEGVVYFHLLFDTHEIIWSNGTPTESLFTGPEALKSVSTEAQQEIKDLFPECCDPQFQAHSARYIPEKGKLMRKLIQRHQANRKPLLDGFEGSNLSV
ncbi:Hint domain-containing protein [Ruegeria sp. Ofav3-42]|uniref:Hint domain-containing protein n=1 Tax=Ruegeria sp. Ofav3-42 TaxID=2917759 RepID=UPI001EF6F51E|nr:Hint domain-containing protein [Ruegeria sp. Ofav3-42]MCG7521438.1 Hint domain-containing protein [Ruegeria sp. Ofav3-42]